MAISEDISFIDQVGNIMLFYTPVCTSTQTTALQCAVTGNFKIPFALYTLEQKEGRGQQNRRWLSEPGQNLALTLVVRVNKNDNLILLNKALTLACLNSLRKLGVEDAKIKWPNDIRVGGYKLAGILIESTPNQNNILLVSGFGVNINQSGFSELEQNATSVKNVVGEENSISYVAKLLTQNLSHALSTFLCKTEDIASEFNNNLEGLNEKWILTDEYGKTFEAFLLGSDEYGRVQVRLQNGQISAFHHGEVRLLKKNDVFS